LTNGPGFRRGFSDLSYFSRAFRRRREASPSEIRAAGKCQSHDGHMTVTWQIIRYIVKSRNDTAKRR
jgi:AraC-like DNA-binding protein